MPPPDRLPVLRRRDAMAYHDVYETDPNGVIRYVIPRERVRTSLSGDDIIIKRIEKYYIYKKNIIIPVIIGSNIINYSYIDENIINEENKIYLRKYLKYKNKYLRLKKLLKL